MRSVKKTLGLIALWAIAKDVAIWSVAAIQLRFNDPVLTWAAILTTFTDGVALTAAMVYWWESE